MIPNDRSASAVDDGVNSANIISFVKCHDCDWKQHGCVVFFYVLTSLFSFAK